MSDLTIVLLVGLGSLVFRSSMIVLLGRVELSERVEHGLKMVAPAVLAGLVAQGIVLEQGAFRPLGSWHLAGIVAALVAWKTRSIGITLLVGMLAIWTLGLVL